MRRNYRIFLGIVGRPFFLRLVWPLGILLFAILQADAIVDWISLRASIATIEPSQMSGMVAVLFLFWGLAAGRALRAVWRQPVIAFLRRQPMSRWDWVRYLAPSLSVAFVPIAAVGWLVPQNANPLVHYLAFVCLAWPMILGFSCRGRGAAMLIALATTTLATFTFAYGNQPAAAYLAVLIGVLLIPLSAPAIRTQVLDSGLVHSSRLVSLSPVFAILRRDVLYLLRMQRNGLFGLAWLGVLAALMMLAVRINGEAAGGEAFDLACGLLAMAVMPAYELLERTKRELGREFMRRRWPIGLLDRGIALVCLILVLMAPAMVAIAAVGSAMGAGYLALFVLYSASVLMCVAALFSLSLTEQVTSLGWAMLVLFAHAALAIALPPVVYGVTAAAAIPTGFLLMLLGLRTFTHRMETTIIERCA